MRERMLAGMIRMMPMRVGRFRHWSELLYRRAGGGGYSEDAEVDRRWPEGLRPAIRARRHPMRFELNLRDWLERRLYFFGVYYQEEIERVLQALLRPGDQFVDVGANIGVTTLVAAGAVGPTGRCYSFEPNPDVHERLRRHVELNGLDNVTLFRCALTETDGAAELYLPGTHAGVATMTGDRGDGGRTIEIETRNGDAVLDGVLTDAPVMVKIDVEGFECHVLRGMPGVLARRSAAWLVEITDHMLAPVGDSAAGLYEIFRDQGYTAYRPRMRRGRFSAGLRLERHEDVLDLPQYDALFVRDDDPVFGARVAGLG